MSKTEKKALSKSDEHPTYTNARAEFTYKGNDYRTELDLEVTAVLASIPCGKCGKTTRDLMKERGVAIPDDDQQVNILQILLDLPPDETRSVLEPDYVFVINEAITLEIVDTNMMAEVVQENELAQEIDKHVEQKLTGCVLCNGCCFSADHLTTLLKD